MVVLAAGYDTRAYRLAPPDGSVTFFELDLPKASAKKQQMAKRLKLAPAGVRRGGGPRWGSEWGTWAEREVVCD